MDDISLKIKKKYCNSVFRNWLVNGRIGGNHDSRANALKNAGVKFDFMPHNIRFFVSTKFYYRNSTEEYYTSKGIDCKK